MLYFRPDTDTIDTIMPLPLTDRMADLPAGLHAHLAGASETKPTMWRRFVGWVSYRLHLRRSRLALGELTDTQLRDIGLRRDEAEREARKVRFHLR